MANNRIYFNLNNLIKVDFDKGGEVASEWYWQKQIKFLGITFFQSGYRYKHSNIIVRAFQASEKRLPIHLQATHNVATEILVYKPNLTFHFIGGTKQKAYFDTISAARNKVKTLQELSHLKFVFI